MQILLIAAALLSLERLFYIWLCVSPKTFAALCRWPWSGQRLDPVDAVGWLFYAFKALQFGVCVWWCLAFADRPIWPPAAGPPALSCGVMLIVGGQFLNVAVFRKLGRPGVFYGGQLGARVEWRSGFPFTWFAHPQYVGAVATIWGVFLILRFPAPDWSWLPLLETFYYWLSTRLEHYERPAIDRDLSPAPEN